MKKVKILLNIFKLEKRSNISKPINIYGPYIVKLFFKLSIVEGNIENNTSEPSNGGIGIKLNTPNIRLISIK